MKLLREIFRLPAAGRLSLPGRREPVRRTVTVPAPLAASRNVVELRRGEAERPSPANADEPPRCLLAAG
jgi:hypothetical protein